MTSEQTIKTPEVRFDRRVSFFVRFLREAVQHMAALARRSFHLWGSFHLSLCTEGDPPGGGSTIICPVGVRGYGGGSASRFSASFLIKFETYELG